MNIHESLINRKELKTERFKISIAGLQLDAKIEAINEKLINSIAKKNTQAGKKNTNSPGYYPGL